MQFSAGIKAHGPRFGEYRRWYSFTGMRLAARLSGANGGAQKDVMTEDSCGHGSQRGGPSRRGRLGAGSALCWGYLKEDELRTLRRKRRDRQAMWHKPHARYNCMRPDRVSGCGRRWVGFR